MIAWTTAEKALFKKLDTPAKIQDFLNAIPINFEPEGDTCRSPREMLRVRKAHCIEGAFFAAAILAYHGEKPLLLDLKGNKDDMDHVVTLFKKNDHWGAISKTNHAVLRYREPVYKTIRELALSYFHEYFLNDGTKTLISFSQPFNLVKFDSKNWQTDTDNLWYIAEALDKSPHTPIAMPKIRRAFRKADLIEIEAGKLTEWKKKKRI